MIFQTVKQSIIDNVLGPVAAGNFTLVGHRQQSKNSIESLDALRIVQVFYGAGDFLKSSGRNTGPVQHDITFRIEFTVSSAAKGDLSTVNNPAATQLQVAAAIAAFQSSAALADALFDDLAATVYQAVMSGPNVYLGLTQGDVSNRWVGRIEKDPPKPQGQYVTLTGGIILGCRVAEQVPSAELTPIQINDITIDLDGDDVERTGAAVEYTT